MIALALGVHLFSIGELLPVFVPLGLVLSAALALRGRAHIDWRLLLARILPGMGVGLGVGL
ncbi:MAG: sulfite exporter TauE/SafE family protein, partial [Myxococcota bacterium]